MVMGGGYIGVEIAQIFSRAGVEVTIVTRRGLLPEAEPEVSEALTKAFSDEGIKVLDGLSYDRFEKSGDALPCTPHITAWPSGSKLKSSCWRRAVSRTPAHWRSMLQESIRMTRGGIVIDPQMRSTRDGVYATGDVTGTDQFVYMAAYGAKLAAKNAMNGNTLSYDNSIMPAVVFSDPQVASVGLTEAQATVCGL